MTGVFCKDKGSDLTVKFGNAEWFLAVDKPSMSSGKSKVGILGLGSTRALTIDSHEEKEV